MNHWRQLFTRLGLAVLTIVSVSSCNGDAPPAPEGEGPAIIAGGERLKLLRDRGQLVCGVSGELPGFSYVDSNGNYAGMDVDICRAVAAAVFDDPNAVEYRNLNAKERFLALQTGEVDLLSRNTTNTMSRSTSLGLRFAPVVFYDGQAVMVKRGSGIQAIADLKDKSICMQTGTTTEQNFTDQMRKLNLTFTPVIFEDVNTVFAAYGEGRCDAVTSDRSQLVSRQQVLADADNQEILDAVLSKEPLAPAVAINDPTWGNLVEWVIYALINAEELGITQANVNDQRQSQDPTIRRFLGSEGELGQTIGLTNDFVVRTIKHVGNYGEIYDRNLGEDTPLKLERGQNNLWTQGGLLYSPPFR